MNFSRQWRKDAKSETLRAILPSAACQTTGRSLAERNVSPPVLCFLYTYEQHSIFEDACSLVGARQLTGHG